MTAKATATVRALATATVTATTTATATATANHQDTETPGTTQIRSCRDRGGSALQNTDRNQAVHNELQLFSVVLRVSVSWWFAVVVAVCCLHLAVAICCWCSCNWSLQLLLLIAVAAQKKSRRKRPEDESSARNAPGLTQRRQTPHAAATFGVLTELAGCRPAGPGAPAR